jgi:hypothetical protein
MNEKAVLMNMFGWSTSGPGSIAYCEASYVTVITLHRQGD